MTPNDNVTGWQQPSAETVYARSTQDVLHAVARARQDKVALYPVSTGLNWGYGSRSPVTAGCRVLDLSAMNRILNADAISLHNPVALIEPGVTQGQLDDFLRAHCPQLTFNVTGSARASSIIGNALERGVGYLGPRMLDLFGLEVVTGTGEIVHTGFRRLGAQSPLAYQHPFGTGPMLDGLFFQSNLGIVTSACFRLRPRRPHEVALSLSLRRSSDLAAFIDLLAEFKREGLITSVTHLANRARSHSSAMHGAAHYLQTHCQLPAPQARAQAERAMAIVFPCEWNSLACLTGNRAQVRAQLTEIGARSRHLARLRALTQPFLERSYALAHALRAIPWARANAAALAAMRPLHELTMGRPSDASVDNLLWQSGADALPATELDASRCGLLYVCPALALDGALCARVVHGMQALALQHGFTLYVTLNLETETSAVVVSNLLFERADSQQSARARACADALYAWLRAQGLEIYRARADMMAALTAQPHAHWQQVRRLKALLDPDGIIAPGRYCPLN